MLFSNNVFQKFLEKGNKLEFMTEELLNQRKETMLALLNDPTYVPMKLKELAMLLNLSRDQRDELREVMESLEQDGKVILTKRGKYKIPSAEFLTGTFSGTAKGFGFVTVEGRPDDITSRMTR